MMRCRYELFAFLSRNAARTVDFFRLPAKQVVEVGFELDI
jgi:K+ transporter